MKTFKKALSIVLSVMLMLPLGSLCLASAADADYTIVSPYADVVWSGDNAWGAYKGSLHSHTTYSDADDTLPIMVKEAYNQDYDFLAISDHGITGVEWNKTPALQLLYTYQLIIDNPYEHLTDEEYVAIKNGTYPVVTPIYAVTYEGNTNKNVDKLLQWILSEEGQYIIEETGYVGVTD